MCQPGRQLTPGCCQRGNTSERQLPRHAIFSNSRRKRSATVLSSRRNTALRTDSLTRSFCLYIASASSTSIAVSGLWLSTRETRNAIASSSRDVEVLAVAKDIRIAAQPQTPEQLLRIPQNAYPHVLILSPHFLSAFSKIQRILKRRKIGLLLLAEENDRVAFYALVVGGWSPLSIAGCTGYRARGTPSSTMWDTHTESHRHEKTPVQSCMRASPAGTTLALGNGEVAAKAAWQGSVGRRETDGDGIISDEADGNVRLRLDCTTV